ncbi:hypothetical protein ABZ403_10150 [Micromonospora zamorensis]|uniref:hypothetical protein n=1 Tax=Micromonospora zamorensis TaxID=709883 RepID=UPI0033CEC9F3
MVLAAKDGVIVQHAAVGSAVKYSAVGPPPDLVGVELPADQQIPTRPRGDPAAATGGRGSGSREVGDLGEGEAPALRPAVR